MDKNLILKLDDVFRAQVLCLARQIRIDKQLNKEPVDGDCVEAALHEIILSRNTVDRLFVQIFERLDSRTS